MKKFKSAVSGGFTLVELLIVIGLLGAISLIVISAINPIEQSNRARDTKYKADAGQLISAVDRYFVSHDKFPWYNATNYSSADSAVDFASADSTIFGICGNAACTTDGVLVEEELKTEFRNRDFLATSTSLGNQIRIGKKVGSSESVYACFTPLSKSVREKACTDGNVYTLAGSTRTKITGTGCAADAAGWKDASNVICLPE